MIGLCAVSTTTFANGYIGIGYGSTNVKDDLTSVGGGNIDDSTTLTKFYGGYQFNKYVALEGGYYNLAQLSLSHGPMLYCKEFVLIWRGKENTAAGKIRWASLRLLPKEDGS